MPKWNHTLKHWTNCCITDKRTSPSSLNTLDDERKTRLRERSDRIRPIESWSELKHHILPWEYLLIGWKLTIWSSIRIRKLIDIMGELFFGEKLKSGFEHKKIPIRVWRFHFFSRFYAALLSFCLSSFAASCRIVWNTCHLYCISFSACGGMFQVDSFHPSSSLMTANTFITGSAVAAKIVFGWICLSTRSWISFENTSPFAAWGAPFTDVVNCVMSLSYRNI